MRPILSTAIILAICLLAQYSFAQQKTNEPSLVPPIMLEKEQMLNGNPLATYNAMLAKEKEYLASKIFSRIYLEQKAMLEEFLGFPFAGTKAMELFKTKWNESDTIPFGYVPQSALKVIAGNAAKTRVVIWGEEHHLPQTRNMFSDLLKELWKSGYRYLATEAFSDKVQSHKSSWLNYESGLYTRDPVYAYAVYEAIKLGYQLISYDTNVTGNANDPGYRDRKQAERIKEQVFDKDPTAKVFIIAGRGHASELVAQDGWTPMAAVLKTLTGIDPLTLYAPTMTERSTREEEHPAYKQAISKYNIHENTIFFNPSEGKAFGSGSFDAYVFFPRIKLKNERPDWLFTIQERIVVKIPRKFLKGKGMRLIQAFMPGQEFSSIPIDQMVITTQKKIYLALPKGKYVIRCIDPDGNILSKFEKERE